MAPEILGSRTFLAEIFYARICVVDLSRSDSIE
jgi:hypothetical protein